MSSMDLPRFAVEVRPDRARVQLVLSGELDLASVTEVQTALEDLRDSSCADAGPLAPAVGGEFKTGSDSERAEAAMASSVI